MERLYTRKGFGFITVVVDLIIIYASTFFVYFLFRDTLEAFESNLYAFIAMSPYIGLFYLILNQIFELDRPKDFTFTSVAYSVTLAIGSLFLITMALSFLTRELAYPRSVLVASSVLQIILLTGWHLFVNRKFLKENLQQKILIVGYEKSRYLAYKLLRSKGMWSKVESIHKPDSPDIYNYIKLADVIFLSEDVDEIKKQEITKYCIAEHKTIFYEPKTPEILLFNTSFAQIDDVPVLRINHLLLGRGNRIFKRSIDLFLCSIAAIIFFIPMIVIALCLKLGGGSVIYKQERITRGGKPFFIYKFRTMIENAEAASGPTLAQQVDNRITKLGNILRATRLDELPQIYNILKGEMSIVGPRPERPFFVEQFKAEIPEYAFRHRVKAGLTGLAQIQGKYNTGVKEKLKYDLLYINGYSLAWDIKLIMQTLGILLKKSSTEGVGTVNYEEEVDKLFNEGESSENKDKQL